MVPLQCGNQQNTDNMSKYSVHNISIICHFFPIFSVISMNPAFVFYENESIQNKTSFHRVHRESNVYVAPFSKKHWAELNP